MAQLAVRKTPGLGWIALLLGQAFGAEAGPPLAGRSLYVADSTDDRVIRFVDRDGSGAIEPESPGEVVIFYDDRSPGPDLSTPGALLWGSGGELFLLDGGTLDAVYVLADQDGDGAAGSEGEWAVFYDDSSPGPNLSTPGAMAFGPEGALYIADDGRGAQRILRIADLDKDGAANGDGEWKVVYDQTALSPVGGPLLDIEAIAVPGEGRLLAADSTLHRILLLTDLDRDGDFLDLGEVAVFYDPLGAHPFGRLQGLALGRAGEVYAADADAGLVVRLQDGSGDGDALDPGEASIFLDPAAPLAPKEVGDLSVDPDGTLVVLDRSRDVVLLARDLDGDGTASGDGETLSWLLDGGSSLTSPSAVATGPALGDHDPEPRVFIAGVEPSGGPVTGGTAVRIRGRFPGWESVTVTFAGAKATVQSASFEAIDCLAPLAERPGPVDVRVTTAAGEAVRPAGYHYREAPVGFVRGDVNADGTIDISDAVAVLSYLFLGSSPPLCADPFDVDDDGTLSITDPIYLLNHLFQGGTPIPPPGPIPGLDETLDDLPCAGGGP